MDRMCAINIRMRNEKVTNIDYHLHSHSVFYVKITNVVLLNDGFHPFSIIKHSADYIPLNSTITGTEITDLQPQFVCSSHQLMQVMI